MSSIKAASDGRISCNRCSPWSLARHNSTTSFTPLYQNSYRGELSFMGLFIGYTIVVFFSLSPYWFDRGRLGIAVFRCPFINDIKYKHERLIVTFPAHAFITLFRHAALSWFGRKLSPQSRHRCFFSMGRSQSLRSWYRQCSRLGWISSWKTTCYNIERLLCFTNGMPLSCEPEIGPLSLWLVLWVVIVKLNNI